VTDPFRLRPEDRADFEAILHLALNTQDIRNAVRADPTGRAAVRLRILALGDADEIAVAARDEYRRYLALDAPVRENIPRHPTDGSVLPAVAVLTSLVAGSSAAALLVLGYLLQLADVQRALPGSLVTAGWVLGLIAAVSALTALSGLLITAIREGGASAHPARLEQTRLEWQQALLTYGMLPALRRYISEDPSLAPTSSPPTAESNVTPPHAD
jgi:hypothetical protein